ncbi:MAG TPA: polyprenyl synthetase family protein [Nocardioides sp.]|nr:polyprenyl synthetase family protein [Nocardioides sp.]
MTAAPPSVDAATEQLLLAADRVVAERVRQVADLLSRVGGDPHAFGGHGIDLAEQARIRTEVGGKKLRPRLAYAGFLAAGGRAVGVGSTDAAGPTRQVVELAAALELLHLFALVHDDVMDRADSRRGIETVQHLAERLHRSAGGRGDAGRYGESVAILLGDLLLAEASDLVAGLPSPVRGGWRAMVVELVHGQLLDVTATASPHAADPDASAAVARLKTGRYTVRRPVELGASLATDDHALIGLLGEWGDLVGDAFALRDDLLGIWGDPDATGKPRLQDLTDGTATRLLAWAAERLDGEDAALVEQCRAAGLEPDAAERLADAMIRVGVPQRAESEIDWLLTVAHDLLTDPTGPGVRLAPHHHTDLHDLAVRLARRPR